MPNPAKTLGLPNTAIQERALVPGYVSTARPAPTAFGDPVYVILPEHSTEVPVACSWSAEHGTSMPRQGARVQVGFPGGEANVPVVLWWEGSYGPIPLVSVLPAEAADGQEVRFQNAAMAAQGVEWRLAYRAASASAYKWEFVGGPEWRVSDQTEHKLTSPAGAFQCPNTANAITFPYEGDYDIGITYFLLNTGASVSDVYFGLASVAKPEAAVLGTEGAITQPASGAAFAYGTAVSRWDNAAAGTYTPGTEWTTAGITYTMYIMTLRVRPVRVG